MELNIVIQFMFCFHLYMFVLQILEMLIKLIINYSLIIHSSSVFMYFEYGVFELSASRIIDRHYGPTVFQDLYVAVALADHRLDGEHHARFHHARINVQRRVEDGGRPVEVRADAVAGDAGHDAEVVLTGVQFDGPTDVREALARSTGLDACVRALFGHLCQLPARFVHVAHAIGRRAVAVETVQVAVDQRSVVGHPVTHDVVHGRAHRLLEPPVVERRRVRVVVDDQVVHETVQVVGGRADRQPILGAVQHELGELAALPQHLDLARVLHFRRTIVVGLVHRPAGLGVRRQRHVLRHRSGIADVAQAHHFVSPEIVGPEFRPQAPGRHPRSRRCPADEPPAVRGSGLTDVHGHRRPRRVGRGRNCRRTRREKRLKFTRGRRNIPSF
ncbi:hypothetical protein AGLY_004644 [Aphis glycines]|uniref:Uncharacterized protein n=1 Tax=Aphis glycines TaxID=307491 RepID=A0A6G0TUJ4_APHGL|nr:hypothetical protein AGLY_004644 [Aphis glycines]